MAHEDQYINTHTTKNSRNSRLLYGFYYSCFRIRELPMVNTGFSKKTLNPKLLHRMYILICPFPLAGDGKS